MSRARDFADLAGSADAGGLTGRNLVINGAMQVAQRGDSTGVTSTGYYGPDRFKLTVSSIGTYSISQSTDAPSGFSHSYKLDCTTADASPAAGDFLVVYHFVEAQNTTAIKSGTSDAQPMTLSFWVKSNETGTYAMNIRQIDGGKFSNNTYTINAADTWEKKTLTFPANTADTITYDNTSGFQLEWWLDSGSNFKGGTSSTAWHTQDNTDRNADSTVAIADSTSNEWYITGVQLEVGDTATDFEHEPYDVTLQKAKRYYEQHNFGTTTSMYGGAQSSSRGECPFVYDVTKRANPTISVNDRRAFRVNDWKGGDEQCSAFTSLETRPRQARLGFDKSTSNLNVGYVIYMNREGAFGTDPILYIDAEL